MLEIQNTLVDTPSIFFLLLWHDPKNLEEKKVKSYQGVPTSTNNTTSKNNGSSFRFFYLNIMKKTFSAPFQPFLNTISLLLFMISLTPRHAIVWNPYPNKMTLGQNSGNLVSDSIRRLQVLSYYWLQSKAQSCGNNNNDKLLLEYCTTNFMATILLLLGVNNRFERGYSLSI